MLLTLHLTLTILMNCNGLVSCRYLKAFRREELYKYA